MSRKDDLKASEQFSKGSALRHKEHQYDLEAAQEVAEAEVTPRPAPVPVTEDNSMDDSFEAEPEPRRRNTEGLIPAEPPAREPWRLIRMDTTDPRIVRVRDSFYMSIRFPGEQPKGDGFWRNATDEDKQLAQELVTDANSVASLRAQLAQARERIAELEKR